MNRNSLHICIHFINDLQHERRPLGSCFLWPVCCSRSQGFGCYHLWNNDTTRISSERGHLLMTSNIHLIFSNSCSIFQLLSPVHHNIHMRLHLRQSAASTSTQKWTWLWTGTVMEESWFTPPPSTVVRRMISLIALDTSAWTLKHVSYRVYFFLSLSRDASFTDAITTEGQRCAMDYFVDNVSHFYGDVLIDNVNCLQPVHTYGKCFRYFTSVIPSICSVTNVPSEEFKHVNTSNYQFCDHLGTW